MTVMQRRMRASGMEYLIKRQSRYHIKNSEERIFAQKNLLERKIRSEELSCKLYAILSKKVSQKRGRRLIWRKEKEEKTVCLPGFSFIDACTTLQLIQQITCK
uniref:Uncharacterized protein n=1 Tax=Nelumbo nucifera TaxID=4432 RepID=A0A822XXJ8_NELNU|nr:TPA_asm: hypothetical protein HUJ06_026501 [Nelumbo nucifera]